MDAWREAGRADQSGRGWSAGPGGGLSHMIVRAISCFRAQPNFHLWRTDFRQTEANVFSAVSALETANIKHDSLRSENVGLSWWTLGEGLGWPDWGGVGGLARLVAGCV